METRRLSVLMIFCLFVIAACASPRTFPGPMPTPEAPWQIKLVQTGGFAGVHLTIQVSSDGQMTAADERSKRTVSRPLSEANLQELTRLVAEANLPSGGPMPSVCADCFIYELEITSRGGTFKMQADDVNLAQSGAQRLIQFLGELRDQALRSAN